MATGDVPVALSQLLPVPPAQDASAADSGLTHADFSPSVSP